MTRHSLYNSQRLDFKRIKNTPDSPARIINHCTQNLCVCALQKEREKDRDWAKDREEGRKRERRVSKKRGELRGELKHIHIVGSVACVYVSALGNWSHKSNSLSEVVVGLLENMQRGSVPGKEGMKKEGKRERGSVIHTLHHTEPECNFPWMSGRDARWGR